MPRAILSDSDDADAIEASLIENIARLDADDVTRWETFTRLVREGRDIADISATFGIPELGVKRILALRSEEHTSELQSLMRISYAVFCLKKKKYETQTQTK